MIDYETGRCPLTPIPTEYMGVRFRSKSEAIFARSLDLNQILWEYEPKEWTTMDLWRPDFKASWCHQQHKIAFALIEYKPRNVTNTYLENKYSQLKDIRQYLYGISVWVACGNAFDAQRLLYGLDIETGWKCFENPPLFRKIEEAARYRFDLAIS